MPTNGMRRTAAPARVIFFVILTSAISRLCNFNFAFGVIPTVSRTRAAVAIPDHIHTGSRNFLGILPVGVASSDAGPWQSYGWFVGGALCAVGVGSLANDLRKVNSKTFRRAAEPEIDPRPPRTDEPGGPGPGALPPVRMPMVDTGAGTIDVMSRLLQDRVLILGGQVNDEMATLLISQMLYLENQDSKKDITIYINSPGGSVSAGMAIFDSMQLVSCDVCTVCFGMAASMGAFLLGAGTKGKRRCLPSARIMIHQPLGGAGGQAADIEIQAREILFLREILNTHMADFTGQTPEKISEDCDRDYYMTPEEALDYGLIDEVVETKSWPRLQKPPRPAM